ncbi:hypothetical protein [Gemmata sp.]|uniref:hypothetical protein n=1 Tax=Gemmata sp. TaxID=1914242 RepID=UPI003F70F225
MSVHAMRLMLGVLFLLLAAGIFLRDWFIPGLGVRFDPLRLNLGGFLALVFGCLNLAKWYVWRSYRNEMATPVRTPLQPDPSAVRPDVPNPELDFLAQDRDANQDRDEPKHERRF